MIDTKKEVLLSICIPTFNRADILSKTVESIVSDPCFSLGNVEVVVSDNASTDDTYNVVKYFLEKHPNVKYSRNNDNIGFLNIISVLDLAQGHLLKLHNDYSFFRTGSLRQLLEIAESSLINQPFIFLGNGVLKNKQTLYLNSIDDFLNSTSFWCSFAGGFCVWRSDYSKHRDIKINKMFPHTSLLLAHVSKSNFMVNNILFFDNQNLKTKGGYNLFNIFAVEFLELIIECRNKHIITERTYKKIKRELLFKFLVRWYCTIFFQKSNFTFEARDAKKSITTFYSNFDFLLLICLARLRWIADYVLKFLIKHKA